MVGKRVRINLNGLSGLVVGDQEFGTITSYGAESYDNPAFPSKFAGHERGLTVELDNGVHVWLLKEDVEVVEGA